VVEIALPRLCVKSGDAFSMIKGKISLSRGYIGSWHDFHQIEGFAAEHGIFRCERNQVLPHGNSMMSITLICLKDPSQECLVNFVKEQSGMILAVCVAKPTTNSPDVMMSHVDTLFSRMHYSPYRVTES
jgi:hypothetical protein